MESGETHNCKNLPGHLLNVEREFIGPKKGIEGITTNQSPLITKVICNATVATPTIDSQ